MLHYQRTSPARVLHEPVDKPPTPRKRTSKADPYRSQIEAGIQAGLSTVRILELARADPDQPYTGGHTVFGDLARHIRRELAQQQAVTEVPIRFEGLPAEYLQVDWGEIRRFPFTQQSVATRYFLACRLKYSRWSWVRFTSDMRQETLFRGLVDCLVALGWVPWVFVFDELGYLPTNGHFGPALYEVIAGPYERRPTILTSNKSLTEWASIVQDVSLAAAIVDRRLHHGQVFYLKGPSWRTRDRPVSSDSAAL